MTNSLPDSPNSLSDTTRKAMFYDVVSKSVLKDRLRKERGGIFVIRGTNIAIYAAGSKAVTQNCLRK